MSMRTLTGRPLLAGARRGRETSVFVALAVTMLAGCAGESGDSPARTANLHQVDGETLHMQCQGDGRPTVILLGGQGASTSTWNTFRAALGNSVRTCAWDYPGVGSSTGAPMMTAERAATALDATLRAAAIARPVVLVGHSIAGLTTRLYVKRHRGDVAGVMLLDPTVPSFARTYDKKEFLPGWDGTTSARQVERVTTWPDIPFEILRHDPAVYASQNVWSAKVEARWARDQAAFAALAARGTVRVVPGSGHNIHSDAPAVSVAAVRRVLAQLN